MSPREFFDTCKQYWIYNGYYENEAADRAFWWDCKDSWYIDKSWNEEKKVFFEFMKMDIPEREVM